MSSQCILQTAVFNKGTIVWQKHVLSRQMPLPARSRSFDTRWWCSLRFCPQGPPESTKLKFLVADLIAKTTTKLINNDNDCWFSPKNNRNGISEFQHDLFWIRGGKFGEWEAGWASVTVCFSSAGTLKKDGCCGNSPTSPRPITAKVRALLLTPISLSPFFYFISLHWKRKV